MKKIKIKFVDFGTQYAFQILEQEGFPQKHTEGNVRINCCPDYSKTFDILYLRGAEHRSDMDVIIKPYRVNENFQHIISHFFDMLRDYLIDMGTQVPGDMVLIKTCNGYFITKKLVAILPEEYKTRYIIDNGKGNTIMVDKIYTNCEITEQNIEINEKGDVAIITLTQED